LRDGGEPGPERRGAGAIARQRAQGAHEDFLRQILRLSALPEGVASQAIDGRPFAPAEFLQREPVSLLRAFQHLIVGYHASSC
jgi:hypothetical protein